ncbi:alpha/beta fold hydrolase [Paraburkholderia sp. UCT2]|uniref:alpha/beta fold hydrolase n=1 Tax=Paraburkholderia sp. UCT2 TaxID=2615208 RepID=UPI001654DBB4|nr:alpha/beta hydrolase [Paraburkholderia sp. UCT2]MBC8731334.1 alpha/beta hydrolase [Paraburkholderia sp. UCT2]
MKETSVRVDGIRSPLLEAGPRGADEAVVFVHGNPGSTADWPRLVASVGEFGRAVAMDMPGFGAADKPEHFDYSVPGYARHLGRLLAECDVRHAHLVMHDFGGPWGLAWAATNPHAVASVTLIDTGVLLDYRWHYLARIWQTRWLGELFMATTTRAGMRLLLRHGNPRGLPVEYVDQAFNSFDAGTRRAVLRLYRNTRETKSAMQDLANALRPLDLPAQVVWGAHDPYISVDFAERQREVFPRAEVLILPDSGHWPFVDNPEAVAGTVVPFLRSQLSPR